MLRQPLEDRRITISRAKYTVDLPCSFMFVASCNPCPCGYYGNAKDEKRPQVVGQNDCIIVGYSMLESTAVFYAFDAECPNCFMSDQMDFRSYRLQMSSSHIASCNACRRKYDLGNGGMIIEGENGKKLIRYRAATTGPYGVLSVN